MLKQIKLSDMADTGLPGTTQLRKMKNGKPVILVVEDDALIRLGAVDMMQSAGYAAVEAEDAVEAIQILETRDDINLVFTDVRMPGTMDGIKLSHYIRERWPPIMLLVASGTAIPRENGLPDGIRFFRKPYDDAQVAGMIAELLAHRAA